MLRGLFRGYVAAYEGLPATVWWLSGVLLISRAGTMVAPFLSLYLTQELAMTKGETGMLFACYGAGGAAGALLGGWLSDRFGPRPVMAGSLWLSGLGLLILGTLETQPQFAIGLFLLALVSESFRPANGAAIAVACPRDLQSRGFALQRLALNVGMTIGPAVGGYLAEIRYELLFWVNAAGCGVAAAFLLAVVPPLTTPDKNEDTVSDRPTSPWQDSSFLLVMGLLFINAIVFFQVFVTFPIYLKEVYRLDEHHVGWTFAVNTLFIVATEMILVHWLRRFAQLRMVALGCVFLGVGFLMIPLGHGFWYAVLTVIIWTIGEMLAAPFAAAYAAGRAPQGSAGRYMGVFTLVFSLAHMSGPWGGLLIYECVGRDMVWYAGGALSLVIVLPLWMLARR